MSTNYPIALLHPIVYGELLPGYSLMRAVCPRLGLQEGQLFITAGRDIDFRIPLEPMREPFCDDEGNDLDPSEEELGPRMEEHFQHMEIADSLHESLKYDSTPGRELANAARIAGYDPEVHGYNFASWLTHRMAVLLQKHAACNADGEAQSGT